MAYTSDLTDSEWTILEALVQTRPPLWTKQEIINGIPHRLKNGCNWVDFPKDFPPYSNELPNQAFEFGDSLLGLPSLN